LKRLEQRFGITDQALKWLNSYLSNRKQIVFIDGTHSAAHILKCNVPQGSVLGPKPFKDYESPIGQIGRSFGLELHLYADDSQVYMAFRPGVNESVSLDVLEKCIAQVRAWMAANYLKLNDDKTEFIVLGSHNSLSKITTSQITIGNCCIKPSTRVKNIGAVFDSTMKMDVQVTNMCRAAWFQLHLVGKLRSYLSIEQTKNVVHSLVTSKLDQNNVLLAGISETLLNKLQRVQNASAKLVFRAKKHEHVTDYLKQLHWLPVYLRIYFKILLLTYKCLHNEGPQYLHNLLTWHQPQRALRSAGMLQLQVPKTRLVTYGDRSFESVAPRLWNSLPFDIRNSKSTDVFKKKLKTYFFKQHFKC
jgi:hypothetical protein